MPLSTTDSIFAASGAFPGRRSGASKSKRVISSDPFLHFKELVDALLRSYMGNRVLT